MADDYDHSIHTNPDALAWAKFFAKTFPNCNVPVDVMHTWFANAMMAMYDFTKAKERNEMVTEIRNPVEFDPSMKCPDCKPSDYIIEGYGMIGGGIGPYTMCGNCGLLLSKSQDEASVNHTTEIKDAQPTDDQADHAAESDSRPDLDK
jgi:hypothetical protein